MGDLKLHDTIILGIFIFLLPKIKYSKFRSKYSKWGREVNRFKQKNQWE